MWGRIAGRLDATAEFAGVDGVEMSVEVPVDEVPVDEVPVKEGLERGRGGAA